MKIRNIFITILQAKNCFLWFFNFTNKLHYEAIKDYNKVLKSSKKSLFYPRHYLNNCRLHFNGILNKSNSPMQFNRVAPISIFWRGKRVEAGNICMGIKASDVRRRQIKERSEILSRRESSTGVKRTAS